jgi:hypothetical protein
MLKINFSFLIITFLAVSNISLAQNYNSIQINGGVLLPTSSSDGIAASIEYDYSFNSNIKFYIYSGYSSWNKYNVIFREDWSEVQQQTNFTTYTSDDHELIPLYIGSKINFNTNKFFTAFTMFEVGYSHLSYDAYSVKKEINPSTGEVLSYYADRSTKEKMDENLFGVGAGIGVLHQITQNVGLILSFKLTSQLNSKYYSFLSGEGTYTAFGLGINVNI